LKNTGRVSLDEINEEIEAVKKEYLSLTANKTAQSFSIDITLENIRLTGTIGSVYKEEYIAFSFSSNKKHWIVANLQALLLSAMGKIKTAIFLEKDGSKISIPVIEPEHAMSRLKLLMQFLQKGTQSPLKYTLKAGEAALKPTANVEKVYKAFMEEANGNYHSGVPSNPYVKILLEEGYFEGLDQDALNEMITISRLLNLKI